MGFSVENCDVPAIANGTVAKRRRPKQAKKVGRKHLTAGEVRKLAEVARERGWPADNAHDRPNVRRSGSR